MNYVLRALMLLGVVLAPACSRPAPPAAAAAPVPLAPVDHPEILATLDAAAQAWNRGDIDGYMAHHVNSPELTFVGSSGAVRGWEQILGSYRRAFFSTGSAGRHVFFSEVRVRPLDQGRAIVHGMYQYLDPSTRERIGHGWTTMVLVRTPEGWKIAHRHNS